MSKLSTKPPRTFSFIPSDTTRRLVNVAERLCHPVDRSEIINLACERALPDIVSELTKRRQEELSSLLAEFAKETTPQARELNEALPRLLANTEKPDSGS